MMHCPCARALGTLVLFLFGGAVALPAAAQQEQEQEPLEWDDSYYPFAREGLYMGIGAQYALENFDTDPAIEDPDNATDINGDDGGGLEWRVGYRMHRFFAAELLFQYYWGFEIKDKNAVLDTVDDKFDGWTMTANGKVYPVGGRIQPYLVAGIGALVFNEKQGDDSAFVARMGGGVDFYITDHFVIDVEMAYLFPAGSISEFQFATFSTGIQYRY
jgi:opacity protein-like surface antigen